MALAKGSLRSLHFCFNLKTGLSPLALGVTALLARGIGRKGLVEKLRTFQQTLRTGLEQGALEVVLEQGIIGSSRDEYGRLVLGDIIIGVDGQRINKSADLYRVLDKVNVDDDIDVEVLRSTSTVHTK
eukprot:gene32652-17669_t